MTLRVCLAAAWLLTLLVTPMLCRAQSTSGGGVFLGGGAPPAPRTCVQVQVTGQAASSLNCLNQALSGQALNQQVQNAAHGVPAAPAGAGSPANVVGTFDQQGVAEQYGQNFGTSAVPYRPGAPSFSNPLH